MRIKETDWAYLAGIIDGEGCIQSEGFNGRHKGMPRLTVCQKDVRLMDYLESTFGGRVVLIKQHGTGEPIYRWYASTRERLIWVLENCKQYLVIKRDQAEVALLMVKKYGKLNSRTKKEIVLEAIEFRKKCDLVLKQLKTPETSKRVGSSKDGMRCSELGSMVKTESNPEMGLPLN